MTSAHAHMDARSYDNYDRNYDYYDDRRSYPPRREPAPAREPARRSGGSRGGAAVGIILRVVFIILLVVFLIAPQAAPYRDQFFGYIMAGLYKYQESPDKAEFTVERVLTIESNGEINYSLYIPIPQDIDIEGKEAQRLESLEFQPEPTDEIVEDRKWHWEAGMLSGGKDTIKITYNFKTAKIKWDISIDKSGTIDDIPTNIRNRYSGNAWPVKDYEDAPDIDSDADGILDEDDVDDDNDGQPDKYRIEPSNPTIQDLLRDILGKDDLTNLGNLNVYKTVKKIYDKIDKKCVYPTPEQQIQDKVKYGSYPKWSTGTWSDKRGDCDDQSILFISLCRAAGIPAMLEIGALYDPQMSTWEGHGWANVYVPYTSSYAEQKDKESVRPMIDIVNDIFIDNGRDTNRFSEWVDDGVKGHIDPDSGEWEYSNLEKRYLAWEYTRGNDKVKVQIDEQYISVDFKAYPPEKEMYI